MKSFKFGRGYQEVSSVIELEITPSDLRMDCMNTPIEFIDYSCINDRYGTLGYWWRIATKITYVDGFITKILKDRVTV